MTSLQRVTAALEHREADRVPFDLGGSVLTGINRHAYARLREHLGLLPGTPELMDPIQQLARVEPDMIEKLGVDVSCVDPAPPSSPGLAKPTTRDGEFWSMTDEWGIGWKMPVSGGHYFDMAAQPLRHGETELDVERFPWPDPVDPARFAGMKRRVDDLMQRQGRAYILGRHYAGIWETALWMCGFDKFFSDMLLNETFARALLWKITELKMRYWEKALETVGESVLLVSEADDLATQQSLLCAPELYKAMIHPCHKQLFSFIRSKARAPVHIFYHTCGAVKPLIPLLIEEGVDVLNPVQVSARDMDTKVLKREFGRDVTFWGGGVDTQRVLPTGTPAQVKDEVRRRIEDLAPGGGFVFATVHNVQSDVPPDNFMAMWETLRQYGAY